MPNFMSWSSDAIPASRPAAQDLLKPGAALAPLHLQEFGKASARLLERHGDDLAVLAFLGPLELALDVAQVELLLRHHALQRLDVLGPVEAAEMGLELIVGQALDGVDRRERDDAADVRGKLCHHLAIAPELFRAAREVRLDLRRHRLGLHAEAVDPFVEDPLMALLVAMVDLHRAVQLALRLHLAEQALQTDHAGVLADAVLLQDERMGLRVADDLAEAVVVDVDRILGFSHRFVPFLFGGAAAASPLPPVCVPAVPGAAGRAAPRDRAPPAPAAARGRARRATRPR